MDSIDRANEAYDDSRNEPKQPECLDGPDGCEGEVEYRMPLSATGKSFPRCEKHWEERLETQEETNRKYGTGSSKGVMLEGYDFLDAGEYLDEDSY